MAAIAALLPFCPRKNPIRQTNVFIVMIIANRVQTQLCLTYGRKLRLLGTRLHHELGFKKAHEAPNIWGWQFGKVLGQRRSDTVRFGSINRQIRRYSKQLPIRLGPCPMLGIGGVPIMKLKYPISVNHFGVRADLLIGPLGWEIMPDLVHQRKPRNHMRLILMRLTYPRIRMWLLGGWTRLLIYVLTV